jgi:hypothetical protein
MALFVSERPLELLLTWLALSGATCLLERIGQPPVVMQPIPSERKGEVEVNNGMLWSEERGVQKHNGTGVDAGVPAYRTTEPGA